MLPKPVTRSVWFVQNASIQKPQIDRLLQCCTRKWSARDDCQLQSAPSRPISTAAATARGTYLTTIPIPHSRFRSVHLHKPINMVLLIYINPLFFLKPNGGGAIASTSTSQPRKASGGDPSATTPIFVHNHHHQHQQPSNGCSSSTNGYYTVAVSCDTVNSHNVGDDSVKPGVVINLANNINNNINNNNNNNNSTSNNNNVVHLKNQNTVENNSSSNVKKIIVFGNNHSVQNQQEHYMHQQHQQHQQQQAHGNTNENGIGTTKGNTERSSSVTLIGQNGMLT